MRYKKRKRGKKKETTDMLAMLSPDPFSAPQKEKKKRKGTEKEIMLDAAMRGDQSGPCSLFPLDR